MAVILLSLTVPRLAMEELAEQQILVEFNSEFSRQSLFPRVWLARRGASSGRSLRRFRGPLLTLPTTTTTTLRWPLIPIPRSNTRSLLPYPLIVTRSLLFIITWSLVFTLLINTRSLVFINTRSLVFNLLRSLVFNLLIDTVSLVFNLLIVTKSL